MSLNKRLLIRFQYRSLMLLIAWARQTYIPIYQSDIYDKNVHRKIMYRFSILNLGYRRRHRRDACSTSRYRRRHRRNARSVKIFAASWRRHRRNTHSVKIFAASWRGHRRNTCSVKIFAASGWSNGSFFRFYWRKIRFLPLTTSLHSSPPMILIRIGYIKLFIIRLFL